MSVKENWPLAAEHKLWFNLVEMQNPPIGQKPWGICWAYLDYSGGIVRNFCQSWFDRETEADIFMEHLQHQANDIWKKYNE